MRTNNKKTEVQIFSITGSINWKHLISANVVAIILVFGDVYATTEIVWLHTVPLNF